MKGILFKPEVWEAKQRVLEEYGIAVTRRVIKPQPKRINDDFDGTWEWKEKGHYYDDLTLFSTLKNRARYQVGETLYIKEAWSINHCGKSVRLNKETWPNGFPVDRLEYGIPDHWWNKRSPLFMPEWAARHFLLIKDVRVERLQEITEEEAIKEGCRLIATSVRHYELKPTPHFTEAERPFTYRDHFIGIWGSIHEKDYPWESNPFVFRYEFEYKEVQ